MSEPIGDMVQVHLLTAYPAALLNRDDAGLAKRIPFGGATRIRVSSQCLKKHWREDAQVMKEEDRAHRSRLIYERLVLHPLLKKGVNEGVARATASFLLDLSLSKSDEQQKKKSTATDAPIHSEQVIVLARAETDFLGEIAAEMVAEIIEPDKQESRVPDEEALARALLKRFDKRGILERSGIKKFDANDLKKKDPRKKFLNSVRNKFMKTLPASIDTALFGRMVTSDLFARVDSAVSVAHAFTTHAEETEIDYFTAVDTLKTSEDDAGAGHISDTELTSGVFYTYAVIDMNQLRDNLGDQADKTERIARQLVQAMTTVSPGAKRGSTAPYAYAEFVLLERGGEQPRTLANAFLEPVRANGTGVMAESAARLLKYRGEMAEMYAGHDEDDATATVSTIHDVPTDGMERLPVRRALDAVFRAE